MRRRSRSGFTLVEVIIGAGLATVLAVGTGSLLIQGQRDFRSTTTLASLSAVRTLIVSTLTSDDAFMETLTANQARFSCLVSNSSCSGAGGPIDLYSKRVPGSTAPPQRLREVASASTPTEGLTPTGQICNSFDPINGNNGCPLRLEASWEPVCASSDCTSPMVRLRITPYYSPVPGTNPLGPGVSFQSFTLSHVRHDQGNSLASFCANMGRVWANGVCNPALSTMCPGQYVLGFNHDGSPICGVPGVVQCPTGQVLTALDPLTGTHTCSPGCAPPPPPTSSDGGGGGGDGGAGDGGAGDGGAGDGGDGGGA